MVKRFASGTQHAFWVLAACLLPLAACDDGSSGDKAPLDGSAGDGSEDASSSDEDASAPAADATTEDASTEPDLGFDSTPLSITSVSAGMRKDPERIAPESATSRLTWLDAARRERSLVLGSYLYQYDFSVDDNQQVISRSANDDAHGHPGFGYVVSHNSQNGNSPLGKANAPSSVNTTIFSGGQHAIHRVEFLYDRNKEGGGQGLKIPVVIDWFVASGRDHPVWSVTYKLGEIANPNGVNLNNYRMDTRAPYGSMNFDGAATRAAGDAVGGVAWGDADYAFSTSGNGLSLNSAWTYNQANRVNFTRTWTKNTNAEFGIVQTRAGDRELSYGDRVVGRERGTTSANNYLLKGDCTGLSDARNYSMPCIGGWPYQLMNYDWAGAKPVGEETGTKLIAWGSPYGYLGASSFSLFDYSGTSDGRGDRSYATFIVTGPKCRFDDADVCNQPGDVARTLAQVEALADARIVDVTEGALVQEAPKGPGAQSNKPLIAGYNDSYAAFYLRASDNQVAFTFVPAANKPVDRPIFVIQNYTGSIPQVLAGGAPLEINLQAGESDAFVSYRASTKELWVTLNRVVDAALELSIRP